MCLIALRGGRLVAESDPLGSHGRLMFVLCKLPSSHDLNVGKLSGRSRFGQVLGPRLSSCRSSIVLPEVSLIPRETLLFEE